MSQRPAAGAGHAAGTGRTRDGRTTAALAVTGTAQPGEVVAVDGHCAARSCRWMVFAHAEVRAKLYARAAASCAA